MTGRRIGAWDVPARSTFEGKPRGAKYLWKFSILRAGTSRAPTARSIAVYCVYWTPWRPSVYAGT